ncbi:MAG: hypothetical protein ABI675_17395 [Chitinophagaceae bacterium]
MKALIISFVINPIPMTDRDDDLQFPWLELFAVTGLSFLGFCFFLSLINNHYPPVFFWIGIITLILATIVGAGAFISRFKKSNDLSAANYDEIFNEPE